MKKEFKKILKYTISVVCIFTFFYTVGYYLFVRPIPAIRYITLENGIIVYVSRDYWIAGDFLEKFYYPMSKLDFSIREKQWEATLRPFVKRFNLGNGEHALHIY